MTKLTKISAILENGGVGVLPTDTIYGLVGSALNKETVARIYKLRKRNPKKPFIILISSVPDLVKFGVKLDTSAKKVLNKFWPGKVSIILPCNNKNFEYLHRGTKSLAFRLPKNSKLVEMLKSTGPLVAPSANLEGKKPATTIGEAQKYFHDKVDFYFDAGTIKSSPSKLVKIVNGQIETLR